MSRITITTGLSAPWAAAAIAAVIALPAVRATADSGQAAPWRCTSASVASSLPFSATSASVAAMLPFASSALSQSLNSPFSAASANAGVTLQCQSRQSLEVLYRSPVVDTIDAGRAARLPWAITHTGMSITTSGLAASAERKTAVPWFAARAGASSAVPWFAKSSSPVTRVRWSDDDVGVIDPTPVVIPPPPPPPDPGGIVISDGAGLYIESVVSMTIGDVVLHPTSLTVTTDVDSWAWRLSATLPGWSALPLIDIDPMPDVAVSINGYRWLFTIEEFDPTAQFGERSLSMSGRSPSGALAKPSAPGRNRVVSIARTAAQLAADELGGTGWVLDWKLPSWLIPAGAFEYRDLAPIEAVTLIAKAAGGIVITDRQASTLRAIPRYPAKPWSVGATIPDYAIAADRAYGYQKKRSAAMRYSAIYVTGGPVGGVVGKIRRPDVAERLAPSVTDPLITHADAVRARGIAELSASYVQSVVTLTTPLAASPASRAPLLPPGTQVSVAFPDPAAAWFGVVRGCAVTTTTGSDGSVTVEQSIEVEKYG